MATKAKLKTTIRKAAKSSTKAKHHRVTAGRGHRGQTLPGMHATTKMTHAGATAHFDVSYLTRLGQKGAALATAILQDCERDYTTAASLCRADYLRQHGCVAFKLHGD